MFVIFGWQKTHESLGSVGDGYCFDCRRTVSWIIGKDTEWVTFYEIRTIPFLAKYYFVCADCNDDVGLAPGEFRNVKKCMQKKGTINGSEIHRALLKRIEEQQLADKNETQLNWIRATMEAEKKKNQGSDV